VLGDGPRYLLAPQPSGAKKTRRPAD
jgi:hypothetical protein